MTDEEEQILAKIIENDGECAGWANEATCMACPLSRLSAKPDGSFYSCIEAIDATELSQFEANKKYTKVALRLLADKAVDDLLMDKDVTE
jgi:hypothetical protein